MGKSCSDLVREERYITEIEDEDMEAFKQMLTQTDDEYLIGLSNKGTVKRA